MNFIVWYVAGGILGWLASVLMRTDGPLGMIVNVAVGMVGAVYAGWLISPLVGVSAMNQDHFSALSLVVALVGAAALLGVVGLFGRRALSERRRPPGAGQGHRAG